MSNQNDEITTILFDLGGVLIRLGDFPIDAAWQNKPSTVEHARLAWLESDIAQQFETGAIDAQTFATQYIAQNQLNVSSDAFLDRFSQWPIAPYPGVLEFITTLRTHYTVAIFSNTNELHWHRMLDEMDLKNRFDFYFASQLIGRAKPAVTAFSYVADEMQKDPGKILFLDDSPKNIAGARQAGLHAEHVVGFDEARSHLTTRFGHHISESA